MASPWPQSPACVWSRQCLVIAASPPATPPPPPPPGGPGTALLDGVLGLLIPCTCGTCPRSLPTLCSLRFLPTFSSSSWMHAWLRCTEDKETRAEEGRNMVSTPSQPWRLHLGQRRNGGLVTRERSMVVTVNHMAAAPVCSSPSQWLHGVRCGNDR